MKKLLPSVSIALAAMLTLNGCLSLRLGGGGRKTTTENNSKAYSVSLGQQLIDLQKARDDGVISDREYNAQKKKLMRSY